MELNIIVEEPSAEAAIKIIAPKIVPAGTKIKVVNLNSKAQLLRKLPDRLRGYAARIDNGEDIKIIILIDRDGDDCIALKQQITTMVNHAGLIDKSHNNGQHKVVTRIVCEELEAWFLGDAAAIRSAYSSLPPINQTKGIFRQPDKPGRGTWEALAAFFRSNGLYRNNYPKIEGARKIAAKMNINENKSKSFNHFKQGVLSLL